jgi:hypothetical protein
MKEHEESRFCPAVFGAAAATLIYCFSQKLMMAAAAGLELHPFDDVFESATINDRKCCWPVYYQSFSVHHNYHPISFVIGRFHI